MEGKFGNSKEASHHQNDLSNTDPKSNIKAEP